LAFLFVDERGNETSITRKDLTPANSGNQTALSYVTSISLDPERYTLKMAAIDRQGRVGSVEHSFQAKLSSAEGLEWSDLLLLDPSSNDAANPVVSSLTSPGGEIGYQLEIYSPESTVQDVMVSLDVAKDETASGAPTQVSLQQAGPSRWVAAGRLSLQSLPEGRYLARATLSKAGKNIAQITRAFRFEPATVSAAFAAVIEGIPAGPMRSYAELMGEYYHEKHISAARALAEMPSGSVEDALEYFEKAQLGETDLRTAAMLHTDVALTIGSSQRLHLEAARNYLERDEDSEGQRAFRYKWSMTVGYYFHHFIRSPEALYFFDAARRFNPEEPEIDLAMGAVHEAEGWRNKELKMIYGADYRRAFNRTLNRAETYYRRTLKANPDHIEAHLRLGHVLKLRQHRSEALEELTWVLEHVEDPGFESIAHLLRGDIHRAGDDFSEAILSYREAVAADPSCQPVATALSHALHRTGDLDGARDVLQRFFELKGTRWGRLDAWWRYLYGSPDRNRSMMAELRKELQ
jgi:tetratricopeptide (TPR) repeat protein